MADIFSVAVKQVAKLPKDLRDEWGCEMIDRVAAWHELREKIAVGIRELDAGLGRPLSKKELLKELRKRHAKK